jgi:hypothetical protein
MKFDESNDVVKDLLTKSEIEEIYRNVDESYNNFVLKGVGQHIFDFRMPESVMEKILKVCKELSGQDDLILEAYQFARYEKSVGPDGEIILPSLHPHHDLFDQPRFTFDYQLGSNVSWPIFVEGKEIILSDNEAITFSGTHQLHWRPNREWSEGEYLDLIFCHLHSPSFPKHNPDHEEVMLNRARKHLDMLGLGHDLLDPKTINNA